MLRFCLIFKFSGLFPKGHSAAQMLRMCMMLCWRMRMRTGVGVEEARIHGFARYQSRTRAGISGLMVACSTENHHPKVCTSTATPVTTTLLGPYMQLYSNAWSLQEALLTTYMS